jgi:hypothetical protein
MRAASWGWLAVSALTTSVRGVNAESGALTTRPQDEGAFVNASWTRTLWPVFLAGRTSQRFVVRALAWCCASHRRAGLLRRKPRQSGR